MGASLTLPSPLNSGWERLGRGTRLPPLSPRSPTPPATPNLCSEEGIREVGESPGTLVLGGAGVGGWLSQGRGLGCVGRGVRP